MISGTPGTQAVTQRNNDERRGCTIVLDNNRPAQDSSAPGGRTADTDSSAAGGRTADTGIPIPERILEMRRMYEHGDATLRQKSRNFYRQGKFMEDYEDDAPWYREVLRYFPTYHDLGLKELRGYFTWRTEVRKGNYRKTSIAFAFIYVYELLNGIGADSAEERLRKLKAFEAGYLDTGIGEEAMRSTVHIWMRELAVIYGLGPEVVRDYENPVVLQQDQALAVLRNPGEHSDREVVEALAVFGGKQISDSVVIRKQGETGVHLFAQVWRYTAEEYKEDGKDLFTACFGEKQEFRWYPLGSAVYYEALSPDPVPCEVNPCRSYYFRDGGWYQSLYPRVLFNRNKLKALIREADRKLRQYLGTGRPLKARVDELWADPYIDAVIETEERARLEAARPRINIRFDDLEKIRRDASETRDSLLTEEELSGSTPLPSVAGSAGGTDFETDAALRAPLPSAAGSAGGTGFGVDVVLLSPFQIRLLSGLLAGEDVTDMIMAEHEMAEIVAEKVNEALFDEIGDTVVECEDGSITLVEDYREDIVRIVGGTA